MPPPTNVSAATATVIATLPADLTQTVHDAGTTYTVWYAYTAHVDDRWISVWGFGDLVTYRPTVVVWLGPVGAPVTYLGGIWAQNVPIQIPVAPGTTYYFEFRANAGNPTPAVLTLTAERGPQGAVGIGSLAVPDDTAGFPLVFLSATTGAVLRSVHPFPAGEAGDTLLSGHVAMADGVNDRLAIYDATYTLVGTKPYPGASELYGFLRAHQPSASFFVADRTTGQVRTIDTTATFGPTTWSPGGQITALAANTAATVLYYADTADNTVKKWNLATDTSGGTFQVYPADYDAVDLVVLADDTVLVNYASTLLNAFTLVVHLSAAGATLHTYAFTEDDATRPVGTPARIATALDTLTTFWVWTHHDNGISRFREIRVSDGGTVTSLSVPEFEGGASQPPAAGGDPVRYGPSFSCPFWITRVALVGVPITEGPGTTPPPAYTLDERHIRRLRRAPHVNHEHKRVFFRSFELDLERGQGLATGQGIDPIITLRLSRDGGQTWGEPMPLHAGRLGAYTQRVIARRLGHARDTVFEVTVSDPVAWSLVGAWLDLEPGTH